MADGPLTNDPQTEVRSRTQQADMYSVLLFDDTENVREYVVICLMQVFAHSAVLAYKIMMEADRAGKALAEVEEEALARRHCKQLQDFGLLASIEKSV